VVDRVKGRGKLMLLAANRTGGRRADLGSHEDRKEPVSLLRLLVEGSKVLAARCHLVAVVLVKRGQGFRDPVEEVRTDRVAREVLARVVAAFRLVRWGECPEAAEADRRAWVECCRAWVEVE